MNLHWRCCANMIRCFDFVRLGKIEMIRSILCLDTCSILDILRDPTRSHTEARNQKAALDILRIAESESDSPIKILIAEKVKEEYHDNVAKVQNETKISLESLKDKVKKFHEFDALLGGAGFGHTDAFDAYDSKCRKIADRWIGAGDIAPQSEEIVIKASGRSLSAQPPAKRGKDSLGDCLIIETYMHRIREYRKNGISCPAVFVSSNIKDYASAGTTSLHRDLESNFEELDMIYAPNMAAAKHHLRI